VYYCFGNRLPFAVRIVNRKNMEILNLLGTKFKFLQSTPIYTLCNAFIKKNVHKRHRYRSSIGFTCF
jgi:hypothetical protein